MAELNLSRVNGDRLSRRFQIYETFSFHSPGPPSMNRASIDPPHDTKLIFTALPLRRKMIRVGEPSVRPKRAATSPGSDKDDAMGGGKSLELANTHASVYSEGRRFSFQ
jgi:hypothetical protein